MKYNCYDEFDLQFIYEKLTNHKKKVTLVKASEFFAPQQDTLTNLQKYFGTYVYQNNK